MPLPLAVLAVVLFLIAVRGVGPIRLQIWQIMTVGAAVVVAAGSISPATAWEAIDGEVIAFLFGMFVIGEALERSGLLFAGAYRLLWRTRSTDALVLALLFGVGAASALLMNDTLAIVGTPLVLLLAREHRIDPKLLLLTLAFAVTLGSVPSPIGNPQNLLIALHGGLDNPFASFFRHLTIPTIVNLALAYLLLRRLYPGEFHAEPLHHTPVAVGDAALARLAAAALVILVVLLLVRVALTASDAPFGYSLSAVALVAALPILIFSPRRGEVLRRLDWHTLLFFAAMFVLMRSVWETQLLQGWVATAGKAVDGPGFILGVSVAVSQLISNVPMVALYLPLLELSGDPEPALVALAAGSTVAGNLLLLGAASNIIIVQNAERRGVHLGFAEFARAGIPLALINVAVYWAFLS